MPLNLVVQTAFLGDLLLCIPLLKKIKSTFPNEKLGLVCRKGVGGFLRQTGLVDEVFEVQKGHRESYSQALAKIQTFQVNYLVSPHESLRTAMFCRQIPANHKISYKNFWNFLVYDERVVRDSVFPDPLRQLSLWRNHDSELAKNLDQYRKSAHPYTPDEKQHLEAAPDWASMSLLKEVLSSENNFAALKAKFDLKEYDEGEVVLLFAGSVWATKRWTEEGFIGTGRKLKEQGYSVIVMGGPGEEELSERIASQIPGVRSLAGKSSIFESALMIAHAALVVGNDSASTHLAAVCETPLIAVFGPTILEFGYRPWSQEAYVVETLGLKCRPCGKHGHKVCPIGTHICMKQIEADRVVNVAKTILPRSPSR